MNIHWASLAAAQACSFLNAGTAVASEKLSGLGLDVPAFQVRTTTHCPLRDVRVCVEDSLRAAFTDDPCAPLRPFPAVLSELPARGARARRAAAPRRVPHEAAAPERAFSPLRGAPGMPQGPRKALVN